MLGLFTPSHVVILTVIAFLVFGSKRLPESARALGQSMRILKAETQGLREPQTGVAQGDAGLASPEVPVLRVAPAGSDSDTSARVPLYDAHTGQLLNPPPANPPS